MGERDAGAWTSDARERRAKECTQSETGRQRTRQEGKEAVRKKEGGLGESARASGARGHKKRRGRGAQQFSRGRRFEKSSLIL